jgi:DDE superfamily endonuclease
MDNLHMHPSEGLVRLVAAHDGRAEDWGPKDQRRLLKSMATRAACLSAPTHRLVCHYPPQQASWLNQSEMWCSIVVRQVRNRARCTAVEALQAQVWAFMEYFNATMAKPCKWTYGRQPLSV